MHARRVTASCLGALQSRASSPGCMLLRTALWLGPIKVHDNKATFAFMATEWLHACLLPSCLAADLPTHLLRCHVNQATPSCLNWLRVRLNVRSHESFIKRAYYTTNQLCRLSELVSTALEELPLPLRWSSLREATVAG